MRFPGPVTLSTISLGVALIGCPPLPDDTPEILPRFQTTVATAREPPRDARFIADSGVLVLEKSSHVRVFKGDGSYWRELVETSNEGLPATALEGGRISLTGGGPSIWNPSNMTLTLVSSARPPPLGISLTDPQELFLSGTEGGAPRDHGRLEWSESGYVFERRSAHAQLDSSIVPGFLVLFDPISETEDTLHRFSASGYGRKLGGVMICCGPPPIFSPQAQWQILGNRGVVFSSGDNGSVLLIPFERGNPVERYSLGIDPKPVPDRTRVRYVIRERRNGSSQGRGGGVLEYWELWRSRGLLRGSFSDRTPGVTQMFAADSATVWVRHFDSEAGSHGLSDRWTVLNLHRRETLEVRIPDLGVVHDMRTQGDQLIVLSSVAGIHGGSDLVTSIFDLGPFDLDWGGGQSPSTGG
jgi:hypothetical protein